MTDCYEHANQTSWFIKGRGCVGQLSDYLVSNTSAVPPRLVSLDGSSDIKWRSEFNKVEMLNTWKEILMLNFEVIFYYGICLEQLSNITKYVQPNVEYTFVSTPNFSVILSGAAAQRGPWPPHS